MTNNDNQKAPEGPAGKKDGLYLISDEEMKLIRRLRELRAGTHLVIIQVDGKGPFGLTLLNGGKLERLRNAEQV